MKRFIRVRSYLKKDGTKVRAHRRRIDKKLTLRKPSRKPTHFYVASYSKAKTREKLKEIVQANPKNPEFDIFFPYMGRDGKIKSSPYFYPEDVRKAYGIEEFTLIGPRKSYYAQLVYTKGKWIIR